MNKRTITESQLRAYVQRLVKEELYLQEAGFFAKAGEAVKGVLNKGKEFDSRTKSKLAYDLTRWTKDQAPFYKQFYEEHMAGGAWQINMPHQDYQDFLGMLEKDWPLLSQIDPEGTLATFRKWMYAHRHGSSDEATRAKQAAPADLKDMKLLFSEKESRYFTDIVSSLPHMVVRATSSQNDAIKNTEDSKIR